MGRNTDISSAYSIVTITPDDNTNITGGTVRAIMVGVAGNVAAIMADGTTGTFPALNAGDIYPFQIARVLSTGTTATGIIGLR